MGIYKKTVYKRDRKGAWVKTDCRLEKAPHDVGRWKRSCQLEKYNNGGEITYLTTVNTKSGLNQKVTQARTYFGKNERVVRDLITTSNKLPKGYKGPRKF